MSLGQYVTIRCVILCENQSNLCMADFTLDDLMKFTQNESKMIEDILPRTTEEQAEPDESVLRNIIAYSKALSVRKSQHLRHFSVVLN